MAPSSALGSPAGVGETGTGAAAAGGGSGGEAQALTAMGESVSRKVITCVTRRVELARPPSHHRLHLFLVSTRLRCHQGRCDMMS
jgi:hypothetical protein